MSAIDSRQDQHLDQEPALWDQQPGEPAKWYGRFLLYLNLGPTRSVGRAQQVYYRSADDPERRLTTGTWACYVRRWRWRERALAWDLHQRDLFALSERNLRHTLRSRRVQVIEDYLESVRTALDTAHIDAVDEKQARTWMPQLRKFLIDLLEQQRKEFERSRYDVHDQDNDLLITADDLRAAQRMLEQEQQAQQEHSHPEPESQLARQVQPALHPGAADVVLSPTPRPPSLLVCGRPDAPAMLDLPPLRAIRAATGQPYLRLLTPHRRQFMQCFQRERNLGRPIGLLHLTLPASPAGVTFSDGLAGSAWLAARLSGIRILFLTDWTDVVPASLLDSLIEPLTGLPIDAGPSPWFAVVPHVITVRSGACPADILILAARFWHAIAAGETIDNALAAALACCPVHMRQSVVPYRQEAVEPDIV